MQKSYINLLLICAVFINVALSQEHVVLSNDNRILNRMDGATTVKFAVNSSDFHGSGDNTQPNPTGTGVVIWGNSSVVYEVNYEYPGLPEYRSLDSEKGYLPMDYDPNGRLLYWRRIYKGAYFNKEGGKKAVVFELYSISKNGSSKKITKSTHMLQYKPGETDHFTTSIAMAMGIGFSKRLDGLENQRSTATQTNQKIEIVDNNALLGNAVGAWHVKFDSESGIVRNAVFNLQKSGLDTTIVNTSGTISQDGVNIAKEGIIQHSAADKGEKFVFNSLSQKRSFSSLDNIKQKIDSLQENRNGQGWQ